MALQHRGPHVIPPVVLPAELQTAKVLCELQRGLAETGFRATNLTAELLKGHIVEQLWPQGSGQRQEFPIRRNGGGALRTAAPPDPEKNFMQPIGGEGHWRWLRGVGGALWAVQAVK